MLVTFIKRFVKRCFGGQCYPKTPISTSSIFSLDFRKASIKLRLFAKLICKKTESRNGHGAQITIKADLKWL